MPTDTSAEDLDLLTDGELEIEGRLVEASNVALRVWLTDGDRRIPAVYKPIRGERPLWDFPDGTLAGRELAAATISTVGGWDLVPPTVLRDGPLGPGTVQRWVGPLDGDQDTGLVSIDALGEVPDGNRIVLHARDEIGRLIVVSHSGAPEVKSLATLDTVLNNADRKAGALIADADRFWVIDHGLVCHAEEKLRTVFWGFGGEELAPADAERVRRVVAGLEEGTLTAQLAPLLTGEEIEMLHLRAAVLLDEGALPVMPEHRHALPWPIW
ncbi:SCO1664 family protein [Calidifontibacter sp. DB0510]|uniref:SCO1664 family protein n=1 Tax=Metallococcus carri TaxID=1656884 RepID=A0A967EGA6_9MICO|nr:SCO1664 family protein [Metallococcus carri]NHN54828.1 SCO1664 family protein [Metallococcus carri]NOP37173.1 SCO1664 family protein [Calidifontibacter sp. DB2511S]